LYSKLKVITAGVAKANFKRVLKLYELDPKPSDLTMSRLKMC
jgi:hypothetical protein